MSRPEHIAPPEIFYNETEAAKYATNSRMIEIQTTMSERAVELLCLPEDSDPLMLLDIGCGSGLSGQVLSSQGHYWVGLDISPSMLSIARSETRAGAESSTGDLVLRDMGDGMPFRPGTFDGAISVSALQWLCNADKSSHNAIRRLKVFFETLFGCLKRGARAVFQVYPESPQQMELITSSAMRAGFTGGLVVDYPNSTRAKKLFLTLFAGSAPAGFREPRGLGAGGEEEMEGGDEGKRGAGAVFEGRGTSAGRRRHGGSKKKTNSRVKTREWVLQKKEHQRMLGNKVRSDTKYTGRKRRKALS